MSDTDKPLNKAELLDQVEIEWKKLDELLSDLSPEQITQPDPAGEWSIKDIIAHLTAWEGRMVAWVEMIQQGGSPHGPKNWDEIHRWNAETFQQTKDMDLAAIFDQFRHTHQAVLDTIKSLSEEQLQTGYTEHWPKDQLWHGIAVDAAWHFKEHREEILKRLQKYH
jgi:uncharacterized protein (TIGR03083 family)